MTYGTGGVGIVTAAIMEPVNVADQIAALERAGREFGTAAGSAALDAVVPPCPDWVVRDLVRHLGGIHRWATAYVSEARTEIIQEDLEELAGGWPPDDELIAWFASGHTALVEALYAAPPDLECFTFLEAPTPLDMWARRQAHETSIHRIDAESAAGPVTGFPAPFAVDGIDELLTAFITRRGRGPRSSVSTRLAVEPVDASTQWIVTYDSDGCRTDRTTGTADGAADVTLRATASDLYAWLWNRPTVGTVEADGDESIIANWRGTVHVRWS